MLLSSHYRFTISLAEVEIQQSSIIGSLAVLTKQQEMNTDYLSEANSRTTEVLATVMNETDRMEDVKDIWRICLSLVKGMSPVRF